MKNLYSSVLTALWQRHMVLAAPLICLHLIFHCNAATAGAKFPNEIIAGDTCFFANSTLVAKMTHRFECSDNTLKTILTDLSSYAD